METKIMINKLKIRSIPLIIGDSWRSLRGFKYPFWKSFLIILLFIGCILLLKNFLVNSPIPYTIISKSITIILKDVVTFASLILLSIIGLTYLIGNRQHKTTRLPSINILSKVIINLFCVSIVDYIIFFAIILLVTLSTSTPYGINFHTYQQFHGAKAASHIAMYVLGFIYFVLSISLLMYLLFSSLLMYEKNYKLSKAFSLALRGLKKNYFVILLLFILQLLITLFGLVVFGIGIIWTLPMFFLTCSMLYIKIFNT